MDGYRGSDDILDKLNYACEGPPTVDLNWGDAMELLRAARQEIQDLRQENARMLNAHVNEWGDWQRQERMMKALISNLTAGKL